MSTVNPHDARQLAELLTGLAALAAQAAAVGPTPPSRAVLHAGLCAAMRAVASDACVTCPTEAGAKVRGVLGALDRATRRCNDAVAAIETAERAIEEA